MKIECSQKDLQKTLATVSAVTEKKTTMPILGNLLLEASGEKLHISGTDLEISIQSSCPVHVIQEGRLCTPATQLLDIIKRLPDPKVTLSRDDQGWLVVDSGKAHFRMTSLDAAEFPEIPKSQDFNYQKVRVSTLKTGIDHTSFAISNDEMRPNLNGIMFEINAIGPDERAMNMVATDGHRLSLYTQKLEKNENITLPKKSIFPRKGINEIKKLVTDYKKPMVDIAITENSVALLVDQTSLFMKLVVGDFPDYSAVIPQGDRKKLVVNRAVFSDSLKRVSLLSDGKSRCIRLGVKPSGVHLAANSPELGEAEEELQAEFNGEEINIGFNARYLLDALSVVNTDNVVLELEHDQSPGVFRIPDDPSYTGVIMPMRI